MKKEGNLGLIEKNCVHVARALSKPFVSIVELNLLTGEAITLKSSDSEVVMKKMPWEMLLLRYVNRRASNEDREIIMSEFSFERLKSHFKSGQKSKSIEVRCGNSREFEWMELSAVVVPSDDKKIIITTENINEERLLKSIVDQFVYSNCDYFVLLDTKNNSYVRLMGNDNGTNIPPASSQNYSSVLVEYNKKYVMSYDVKRVTKELEIPQIVKSLDDQDEYFFYFDGCPEKGIVRRKRIQMAYQDRLKGLVLFTRTDVTEVYRKERERNEQLVAALIKAQTDSLTGLYNQAATADIINEKLIDDNCSMGAFLFIDVDNFKMVNDSLGHLKGDYLLELVANLLKALIGDCGVIGRIGGDEFLIFWFGEFSIDDIKYYAQKICEIFSNIEDGEIQHISLSCSVGISLYPQDGKDYDTLVHKADNALYDSKRQGKNKYSFYKRI
ncbi:MAG: diguanylate cyclase [Anaerovoracaceae bacterium]